MLNLKIVIFSKFARILSKIYRQNILIFGGSNVSLRLMDAQGNICWPKVCAKIILHTIIHLHRECRSCAHMPSGQHPTLSFAMFWHGHDLQGDFKQVEWLLNGFCASVPFIVSKFQGFSPFIVSLVVPCLDVLMSLGLRHTEC